jgi:hypothetical protein
MRKLLVTQDNDPTALDVASAIREDGDEDGVVLLIDSSYMATRSSAHAERVRKAMESGVTIFLWRGTLRGEALVPCCLMTYQ